jgi:hypothetical protein
MRSEGLRSSSAGTIRRLLHVGVSKLLRLLPFVSSKYDYHFPPDVKFARHAMAIDEYRKDFLRVPWGGSGTVPDGNIENVTRFRQVWFAGNHSDIGGSYPENESRLSDITPKWMKTFIAEELPDEASRIIVNDDLLRPFPSSAGMMHDELMVGHMRANLHIWPEAERKVDPEGVAHDALTEHCWALWRPSTLKLSGMRNKGIPGLLVATASRYEVQFHAFFASANDAPNGCGPSD